MRQGIGIHEQTLEMEFPAGPKRGCNSEKVPHWQIAVREIEMSIRNNMSPQCRFLQHIWEVRGLSSTGQSFGRCAMCMSSEFGAKTFGLRLSLFLFCPGMFSLFPWREKEKERERERRREREKLCDLRHA